MLSPFQFLFINFTEGQILKNAQETAVTSS